MAVQAGPVHALTPGTMRTVHLPLPAEGLLGTDRLTVCEPVTVAESVEPLGEVRVRT